ncbi:cyclin-domain-containing protein [Ascodesmis nigricans]|uniref:Cyclin-domain-containing protein n=1 Tax=Ascodesmis nigricans TaxID=341454 RepID=A0A4S2N106_9PEZI|nr:cyclin-domain-containing protein [Ascodesmis nigricans]
MSTSTAISPVIPMSGTTSTGTHPCPANHHQTSHVRTHSGSSTNTTGSSSGPPPHKRRRTPPPEAPGKADGSGVNNGRCGSSLSSRNSSGRGNSTSPTGLAAPPTSTGTPAMAATSRTSQSPRTPRTPGNPQNLTASTIPAPIPPIPVTPKRQKSSSPAPKALPRLYQNVAPTDLVILISDMLHELVQLNDRIPLSGAVLTRFHSRAPPTISISDYLSRLTLHASLQPSILLSMVYYIDILSTHYPPFIVSSLTVHRFLITAATVASKGLCDAFLTNTIYARVGGVSLLELNMLELEFLVRVGWRIVPQPEVLEEYYRSLVGRLKDRYWVDEEMAGGGCGAGGVTAGGWGSAPAAAGGNGGAASPAVKVENSGS